MINQKAPFSDSWLHGNFRWSFKNWLPKIYILPLLFAREQLIWWLFLNNLFMLTTTKGNIKATSGLSVSCFSADVPKWIYRRLKLECPLVKRKCEKQNKSPAKMTSLEANMTFYDRAALLLKTVF